MNVGRVGRAHGHDGSFWVEGVLDGGGALCEGADVLVAEDWRRVARRGGTASRPLVRLEGVQAREAAGSLRGELLRVAEDRAPLDDGEWLVEDLVGAHVEGLGEVRAVLAGSSCDLLEVGEGGSLVPFVADAVRSVDVTGRRIVVDLEFLGLAPDGDGGSAER